MHFKFIYLIFSFLLVSFYTFSNEKIDVSVYNKNITFNVEVAKTLEKNERWSKIADIVRTRTREECIERYRYIAAMLKRTSISKNS